MAEKTVMVIDGNNYFSRMFYTVDRGQPNWLEEILNRFLAFREKNKDNRFVFTFDTCKSSRRLALYPRYKELRDVNTPEEDKIQRYEGCNAFMNIVKFAGFTCLEGEGYEADDYIACVVSMLKLRNKVIIVSTDKDMLQLIDKNVEVYEPTKMITIDESNFEYVLEIKKKYYLDYKCLCGDDSDKIPGIHRIGDKIAKKLIAEYGNLQEMIKTIAAKPVRTKKEQDVIDNLDILNRNRKLMSLNIPIFDTKLQEIIKDFIQNRTKCDKKELHRVLGELKLGNVYKNFLRICFV